LPNDSRKEQKNTSIGGQKRKLIKTNELMYIIKCVCHIKKITKSICIQLFKQEIKYEKN